MSSNAVMGPMGSAGGTLSAHNNMQRQREQWIDAHMATPKIGENIIRDFLVTSNASTKGIDISFSITSATGIDSVALLRANVMDVAQATMVQSWTAQTTAYTYSDTAQVLQQYGQAFYWLSMKPVNTLNGSTVTFGPEFILLNPSLLPPMALTEVSASHAAAVNGNILVTCNVAGLLAGYSVKIYLSGYNGNASAVAIAQRVGTPLQFTVAATGETVTIKAIQVSQGGAGAPSGPTCTLTLNSAATAPAKPEGVTVAQIATGNQVMWPASLEAGITGYQLWRGQRSTAFASASLLATITASDAGTVQYLDTGGLAGDWQYFVIAVSPAGNSPQSSPANPQVLFSSALVPPNLSANTNNTAVLDSIDAGTSATIRIYGPGGLGTSYTRQTGFGAPTRPAGSVTGLAYNTKFYVIFEVASQSYAASTSYTDTLPDGYEWVAVITTLPSGGTGSLTATGTANVSTSGGSVTTVTITNPGYGYGSATVSFAAGTGTGAAGTVVCSNGQVTQVNMTNGGSGYASSFAVTFTATSPYTGGGGSTGSGGARYVLAN